MFNIRDFVEFDNKGRAVCPCCALDGKTTKKNLALVPNTDGAYKCHRGCTPQDIRAALGNPKPQIVPTALVHPTVAPKSITVSPQKIKEAHERLVASNGPAKAWLYGRGMTDEMIARYQLGIVRSKSGDRHLPAISIPLPNADGTAYYQKKRVAPWLPEDERPNGSQPWSQAGIPARTWITHYSQSATQTWLCEGEWDAILLGWAVRHSALENDVQVACFTAGCGNVPPSDQLELLPGQVFIFYDRNDKPLKNGAIPGDEGARKVALALGDRARIALVPMPEDCTAQGWDVSDALNAGFTVEDFIQATNTAIKAEVATAEESKRENPLRERLIWNDDLIDRAPDYTEWLVPDLLTADELFLLAAGPRAGKSLLAMTLAKAVAEGGVFLDRPVTQGTVLYVCLEDGDAKLKERETAQGWSRGLPVAWFQKFKLSELKYLQEIAQELDPRLIILDTLSRIKDASISESSAEMSQYLEPLQEMAKDLGCCVLLIHHTGKISVDNAGNIDVFDTIRGSSAIRAVCRGSLIIAAGEHNYRLFVENGWGKYDLNVVLDANTWTWKLLGQWKPTVNGGQQDQVLAYLKQVQSATIDQIWEATQIPKKSIYKALERLQASEVAEEKVVKAGRRRSFTYRLALFDQAKQLDDHLLFDTIRQSNNVSNSENVDTEGDKDAIRQKNNFSISSKRVIRDQSGTSADCDTLITLPQNDHSAQKENLSNIACSKDNKSISPIRQLFDKPDFVEYKSVTRVEVLQEGGWKTANYLKPASGSFYSVVTQKLSDAHWVEVAGQRVKIAEPDIRPIQQQTPPASMK